MNLIILEDEWAHPLQFISDFRKNGHDNTKIKFLYYQDDKSELDLKKNVKDLYKKLKVEISHIDPLCFFDIMNPLFSDTQNIFLFDFALGRDAIIPDIYKIHIAYAKKRISENQRNKDRFFFYTTRANAEQLSNLITFFPDHVVVGSEGDYNGNESVSIDFTKYNNFIEIMNNGVR